MKFFVLISLCTFPFYGSDFQVQKAKHAELTVNETMVGVRKQVEVSKLPKRVLQSFKSGIFHNMRIKEAYELKDQEINKQYDIAILYELKTENSSTEMKLIYDENGNLHDAMNAVAEK